MPFVYKAVSTGRQCAVFEIMMAFGETPGRFLLRPNFFLPGISKVAGYADTLIYMSRHNISLPEVLPPITIILQVGEA